MCETKINTRIVAGDFAERQNPILLQEKINNALSLIRSCRLHGIHTSFSNDIQVSCSCVWRGAVAKRETKMRQRNANNKQVRTHAQHSAFGPFSFKICRLRHTHTRTRTRCDQHGENESDEKRDAMRRAIHKTSSRDWHVVVH